MARANGWTVGTVLAGDEGYGETVIEITAVTETAVLARTVSLRGLPEASRHEGRWDLTLRPWRVVSQPQTAWVYTVRSDVPLGLFSGIGNVPVVTPSQYPLLDRDRPVTVCAGPQAAPSRLTLELIERGT